MRRIESLALALPALVAAGSAAAAPGLRADGAAASGLSPGLAAGHAGEYLLGIVAVMLALGAFAFVMRRLQGRVGAGRGSLRVRAALPLGGKERLVIVEAEGERLLLGVSAAGVNLVRCLAPATDEAPAPAPAAGDWLSRTLGRERVR